MRNTLLAYPHPSEMVTGFHPDRNEKIPLGRRGRDCPSTIFRSYGAGAD